MYNELKILSAVKIDCKLEAVFDEMGIRLICCEPVPLNLFISCCKEQPFSLIIESETLESLKSLNMLELIEKLNVGIIAVSGDRYIDDLQKYPDSLRVIFVRSVNDLPLVVNILTAGISEKPGCKCTNSKLNSFIDDIVHEALDLLCFTANFSGTAYIREILKAICTSRIKTTDSLVKVMYPYAAKKFSVTPTGVECCIHTAISKCWNLTSDAVHAKYFGTAFSYTDKIPTNREFILILADNMLRRKEKYKNEMYDDIAKDIQLPL